MIAVSMNTSPSIVLERILSDASGCLDIPSDALFMATAMAIAPAAATIAMIIADAIAFEFAMRFGSVDEKGADVGFFDGGEGADGGKLLDADFAASTRTASRLRAALR